MRAMVSEDEGMCDSDGSRNGNGKGDSTCKRQHEGESEGSDEGEGEGKESEKLTCDGMCAHERDGARGCKGVQG